MGSLQVPDIRGPCGGIYLLGGGLLKKEVARIRIPKLEKGGVPYVYEQFVIYRFFQGRRGGDSEYRKTPKFVW